MARKRYQKGSLIMKGTREQVWYGRWLEDRSDGTRVHRSVRLGTLEDYPTRKLAFRALEEQMTNNGMMNSSLMQNNNHQPSVTFSDFCEKWQKMILPNHKPSSQNSERVHCTRLRDHFGNMPISDIDTMQMQAFISGLNGNGERLAPKTVLNVTKTISTMWKTAKAWKMTSTNPLEGLVLPRLNTPQVPCFSIDQAKQVIDAAPEPYKTLFWVVAETGIRGGEVCGLSVPDIDFSTKTIIVQRSAWRGRLQSPKTENAIRCFPISDELLAHLQEYLKNDWKANAENLLFCDRRGRAINNGRFVTEVMHPLTDRLGLPRGGLHAFRHCNATTLDGLGVPVAVRMARLGHAQFTTTLKYTHAQSADHRRVAEALGKKFCPSLP
jgi:integrase